MERVGRFLTILVVAVLVVAVWAILVAPDYDLDPTMLRGKLAVAWFLCAALALSGGFLWILLVRRLLPGWTVLPDAFPSLLDLTCSRLC